MKSLRSAGSVAGRARRRQVFGRALEKGFVGEHRQARGAAALVARGDRRRVESGANHAAARARLLDFGDDRRLSGGELRPQRALEIPRPGGRARRGLDLARGPRAFRGRDLVGLGRENAREDVGHRHARPRQPFALPSFFVSATNSASFFFAAPEAIAARARSMPSAIDPATSAA